MSITSSRRLPKLMSIESVMPSKHLMLCCPVLLLPSIFPSIRVFTNESALHIRWSKYWSFSFSISPSNECPELITFRMDWLDLLAVQGTLKSLLQHHSSKASILRHSVGLDNSLNVNIERHKCILSSMFFKLNNVFKNNPKNLLGQLSKMQIPSLHSRLLRINFRGGV